MKFCLHFTKMNGMFAQVSLVASGTVIAQGLNMVCMPVLSRIYSPEDFGVMAVFTSVMTILVPFATLRYYLAIALPKSRRYSHAAIVLSVLLEITFSCLLFFVFLLFGNKILVLFGIGKIAQYKLLIPFGVLFYGLYVTFTQWAIREAEFGVIARTKITQSASGNLVKLLMGILNFKPLGLILGTIVSYGGGITAVLRKLVRKNGMPKSYKTDVQRIAIKYRKFPKYDVFAAILNTGGTQIIPVMVFAFFGAKAAGFFSVANQLLVIPSVFIGDAIGQVFLQRASKAKYNGNLASLTLKTYRTLMKLGMFPLVMIAVFAPVVFQLVLGAKWHDAGVYSQLLVFFTLFSFCFSPIAFVYSITNRQDLYMKLEIFYCAVRVGAFWLGAQTGNPKIAVFCFGITAGLAVIVRAYYALKIAGVCGADFFRALSGEVSNTALLSAPVIAVYLVTKNLWLGIAAAAIMTGFYLKAILKECKLLNA